MDGSGNLNVIDLLQLAGNFSLVGSLFYILHSFVKNGVFVTNLIDAG